MRLLNTTTKKLESFYDEYVPPYAILSHTWGDQEVLFRHIDGPDDARSEGEKRKGYPKIMGACKQAIKDGWEYIWIDTCCIDKESSAELSEAINSMYRWYRQAQVCYVYLKDVHSSAHDKSRPAKDNGNEDGTPVETVPFGHSRWFTRGWTLQELLAPQYIVFYSKNWVDIGTRASLQSVISTTTGIRVEMLVAYDPNKASVAERMSWAAFRKTSRKEDIAYCLMGLFGVNMPLLYGEGSRAFRRLQEEIMKVSDDHSLFAWKGCYSSYVIPDCVNLLTAKNYKAQGMLANSPWDFRDEVDIVPGDDGAFSPYSMTNQGLQIQLPLQPIDSERDLLDIDSDYRENIFKATLKCTIRDKTPTRWLVIYLKMIRKGYYERVFAHLLHETETDPNESELASLVVPQVDTSAIDIPTYQTVDMKTLPTESGFTTNGHSLVEGYEHIDNVYIFMALQFFRVTVFDNPEGGCFAVVFGFEDGLFWLDVHHVDKDWSHPQKRKALEDSIKQAYQEGGSRYNRVLWHLDRLYTGNLDYSVVVSAKKFNNKGFPPSLRITVDIQRIPFLARWRSPTTPLPTSTSDSFYHYYAVHPEFKEECGDWITIFNPKVKRLGVSPVHSIMYRHSLGAPGPYCVSVTCVQFSPDGKYLAVAWSGLVVQVYDTNTGEPCVFFGDSDAIDDVRCVCFSPNGKFLATGDINGRIVFWDVEKRYIHKVFNDRQDSVWSLCFSSDGRLIVSGSENGIIQIWDIADETSPISTIDSPLRLKFLYSIVISHNGRLIAGNCNDTAWIWDMATTRLVKQFKKTFSNVVFTPDGKELVLGGHYGLGYLDVSELVPTQAIGRMSEGSSTAGPDHGPNAPGILFQGNPSQQIISKSPVKSVAVSRDGHSIISGSPSGYVELWNVSLKNATWQFMLQGHIDLVTSVDISPVGNIFATGGYDGRVRICVNVHRLEWQDNVNAGVQGLLMGYGGQTKQPPGTIRKLCTALNSA